MRTGEHSNYPNYNPKILLLLNLCLLFIIKGFQTNFLNYNQYFKDQLSYRQPSHIHNTKPTLNIDFSIPLFNHLKTQKYYTYVPSNSHIQQPKDL